MFAFVVNSDGPVPTTCSDLNQQTLQKAASYHCTLTEAFEVMVLRLQRGIEMACTTIAPAQLRDEKKATKE